MPNLYFVSYVTTVVDLDQPHITDLDIQNVGGQTCLYSTTLYDGQISSWNINGTGLSVIEDDEFLGGLRAGGSRGYRKFCSLSNAKEEHLENLVDFEPSAPLSRVAEVQWPLI